MEAIRSLVVRYPGLVACTMLFVLLIKGILPAGYMPVMAGDSLRLALCTSRGAVEISAAGIATHGQDDAPAKQYADMPCMFAGLCLMTLLGADPMLLAAALLFLFVLALHFRPQPLIRRADYLAPPSQGPPASI